MSSSRDGAEQNIIVTILGNGHRPLSNRAGPCGFSTLISDDFSACSHFVLASYRRVSGGFVAPGNAVVGTEGREDRPRFVLLKWSKWVPSGLDIIHAIRSTLTALVQ